MPIGSTYIYDVQYNFARLQKEKEALDVSQNVEPQKEIQAGFSKSPDGFVSFNGIGGGFCVKDRRVEGE